MFEKYIGIPYVVNGRDFNGFDCYGGIWLAYKTEKNIDLPDYKYTIEDDRIETLSKISNLIDREKLEWDRVDKPDMWDVVILRSGKYQWHIGLMVDRKHFLHASEGTGSLIQSVECIEWRNRIEEYRRYADYC